MTVVRARVIAIANQKGGVGKTTTAINLAACLVERRRSVLLIDLDPQGNATSGMGIDKTPGGSVYRTLLDGGDLTALIRHTAYRNLDIVPSELDLAGAEVDLIRSDDPFFRLRRTAGPLRETTAYDFVFIDCPPSLGALTMNGLCAADSVLIPLQCEYFALEGLGTIARVIDGLRAGAHPALEIDGIVMTMYSGRTRLAQQVVQEVANHFPDKIYESLIPRTVRLGEAPSFGKPAIVYDRNGIGSTAYRLLAREFLRRHAPSAAAPAEAAPDSPPAAFEPAMASVPPSASNDSERPMSK